MKIEGIIFDWAGTTVDFGCMAPVRAFMDSFAANGVTVTEFKPILYYFKRICCKRRMRCCSYLR